MLAPHFSFLFSLTFSWPSSSPSLTLGTFLLLALVVRLGDVVGFGDRHDAGTHDVDGVRCLMLLGLGECAVAGFGIVVGWCR